MVRSNAEVPYDDEKSEAFSNREVEKDISYHGGQVVDPMEVDEDGDLSPSQRMKIDELLGAWEEPEASLGVEVSGLVGAVEGKGMHASHQIYIPCNSSSSGRHFDQWHSAVSTFIVFYRRSLHVLDCLGRRELQRSNGC